MGRHGFLEKRKMSITAYKRNDSRVIYADYQFNGRQWVARIFERGFKVLSKKNTTLFKGRKNHQRRL